MTEPGFCAAIAGFIALAVVARIWPESVPWCRIAAVAVFLAACATGRRQ